MQRQVELISAAWGLGGVDPGCADAPAVLAPLLLSRLRECAVPTLPGPILRPSPTERRKQVAVSKLCALLASAVADSLRHGRLPCVLGGDHTCAGGTWTGVARTLRGDLGLVWVDAHMDSHTPGTSHTGACTACRSPGSSGRTTTRSTAWRRAYWIRATSASSACAA